MASHCQSETRTSKMNAQMRRKQHARSGTYSQLACRRKSTMSANLTSPKITVETATRSLAKTAVPSLNSELVMLSTTFPITFTTTLSPCFADPRDCLQYFKLKRQFRRPTDRSVSQTSKTLPRHFIAEALHELGNECHRRMTLSFLCRVV